MIEVAEAIKSFLPTGQQANFPVSPLEEPVFILTSSQLQEILSQAIAQALERPEALPEGQIGQEKLLQVVEAQAQEIKALQVKLEAQAERLETLEKLEELYHGKPPAPEERPILREVYQRREEAQASLPSRVWSMEEDLQCLEQEVQSLRGKEEEKAQGGRKTETRMKEVKGILKAYGGSRTFQELERSLGLSPQQFTYLVSHLDKRVFEISRRPGTKRGEKVLGLRVRIKEPVVFM